MKQEANGATFRASRETCVRGARGVLSECCRSYKRPQNTDSKEISTRLSIVLLLTHEHGRHWVRAVASERNDCRA